MIHQNQQTQNPRSWLNDTQGKTILEYSHQALWYYCWKRVNPESQPWRLAMCKVVEHTVLANLISAEYGAISEWSEHNRPPFNPNHTLPNVIISSLVSLCVLWCDRWQSHGYPHYEGAQQVRIHRTVQGGYYKLHIPLNLFVCYLGWSYHLLVGNITTSVITLVVAHNRYIVQKVGMCSPRPLRPLRTQVLLLCSTNSTVISLPLNICTHVANTWCVLGQGDGPTDWWRMEFGIFQPSLQWGKTPCNSNKYHHLLLSLAVSVSPPHGFCHLSHTNNHT